MACGKVFKSETGYMDAYKMANEAAIDLTAKEAQTAEMVKLAVRVTR